MIRASTTLAAAVVALAVSGARPATAQEMDHAVFHYTRLQLDAAERDGSTEGRWNGAGWIGTDFDRLWWSTTGEHHDGELGTAEVTLLYGHYARRFWDVAVGYRQDIEPALQGYLGLGVMGLAPYWFEVSLFGFVSHRGRPSLRFEADNDLFVTQRLLLQPLVHLDWLITDDAVLGLPSGLRSVEAGVRLRYEIRRKLAPYVDLAWVREREAIGSPASTTTSRGTRFGAGLQLIY